MSKFYEQEVNRLSAQSMAKYLNNHARQFTIYDDEDSPLTLANAFGPSDISPVKAVQIAIRRYRSLVEDGRENRMFDVDSANTVFNFEKKTEGRYTIARIGPNGRWLVMLPTYQSGRMSGKVRHDQGICDYLYDPCWEKEELCKEVDIAISFDKACDRLREHALLNARLLADRRVDPQWIRINEGLPRLRSSDRRMKLPDTLHWPRFPGYVLHPV